MSKVDIFKVRNLVREEVAAVQAVARGEANEHQQVLCMELIIKTLCRSNHIPYVPDSFDQTAFFSGRVFVGKQLEYIIKTPLAKQVGEKTKA